MVKAFFAIMGGAAVAGLALVSLARADSIPGDHDTIRANAEPVLVELFTSQGCSSCPPADELASRLVHEEALVVVSRPVTYWDRLGWKDTLALPANTDLQRTYARRGLAGRNGVYTPQIVVDGALGTVGSREQQVRQLINAASHQQSAAIRATREGDGSYTIGLGGEASARAELVLLALTRTANVDIKRGENTGRRIGYTNVLLSEHKITDWSGGKSAHIISADSLKTPGADRHALVLREPNGGPVLAARYLD